MEIVKANYERDEHKWNAEKLQNKSLVNELEQVIKAKDDDYNRREQLAFKKHQGEMQEQADGYEDQFDDMQTENHKVKNQNLYLETHSHEQKLEEERMKRLISSSFYSLGMIQVQKNKTASRRKDTDNVQVDWLDSQKDNLFAHSYEMIFKHP